MESFDDFQDNIGQLPMLKTYLHFCLGFPLRNEHSETEVVSQIHRAALQMTGTFPWLAAKVTNEGRSEGKSGLFRIRTCPQFKNTFVRRVKECKDSYWTYREIVESEACLKVLDGSVLGPRTAFPLSYEDSEDDPAPVLALQINLVRGGLLLNWACQHNIMDASGLSQVIQLFACAMRDEPFPDSAIAWGNRRREDLIPLLRADEPGLSHSHLRRPAAPNLPLSAVPFQAFTWCDFRFSAKSLKGLKALASNPHDFVDDSVTYVSTNDALTAFCWQAIARARLRLGRRPPETVSKLARAVDTRSIMGIPQEYMGHMVYIAASFLSLGNLAGGWSLARVASELRRSLSEASRPYEIRSFVTLIANTEDKSTIAFAGKFDPDQDVGSSSGLAMRWRLDYGPLLGTPDFMNRPHFTPLPSTVYVLPMRPDGGVDVQLSLRPEELSSLKADQAWNSFAEIYEK